jgi:hypothetical protein
MQVVIWVELSSTRTLTVNDTAPKLFQRSIPGISIAATSGSRKVGEARSTCLFIDEFTDENPWIHLGIAGTAWQDDVKPWNAKGATGAAVRTLVDLAIKFGSNAISVK